MKRLLVVFFVTLIPLLSIAQWKVGLEAGAGFNYLSSDDAQVSDYAKIGVKVSAIVSHTTKYRLYLESGLGFASNKGAILSGFKNQYKTLQSVDSKLHYLQLPVSVGYKIQITNNWSIIPKVGMWVAVGVGGHSIVTGTESGGTSYQVRVLPFESDSYTLSGKNYDIGGFSRQDWGTSFGVDIHYKHFALRAAFDLGLQDLNFDLGSPESHSFTLTMGYFF